MWSVRRKWREKIMCVCVCVLGWGEIHRSSKWLFNHIIKRTLNYEFVTMDVFRRGSKMRGIYFCHFLWGVGNNGKEAQRFANAVCVFWEYVMTHYKANHGWQVNLLFMNKSQRIKPANCASWKWMFSLNASLDRYCVHPRVELMLQ